MSARTCANCQDRIIRNPDQPKRWLHATSGTRKCNSREVAVNSIAQPTPLTIPTDVTMVTIGDFPVWYRECMFWDNARDLEKWTTARQGSTSKTSTELIEDAERRGLEVYSLGRREKLSW